MKRDAACVEAGCFSVTPTTEVSHSSYTLFICICMGAHGNTMQHEGGKLRMQLPEVHSGELTLSSFYMLRKEMLQNLLLMAEVS